MKDRENAIQVFNFESKEIRVVVCDGEPWFVAKDVCGVLGLANPNQVIAALDVDEKDTCIMPTNGGNQALSIASESGLYALIFKSRKSEAKRFRKWVTSEVLPSIRKTGSYSTEKMVAAQQCLTMVLGQGSVSAISKHDDARLDEPKRKNRKAKDKADVPKDYLTIKEFSTALGIHVRLGKKASELSRKRHIKIEDVKDDSGGIVHSYRKDILEVIFAGIDKLI